MLLFFSENLATIIISLILLIVIFIIIRKMIRNKKNGVSCSCGCGGCSGCSSCDTEKDGVSK